MAIKQFITLEGAEDVVANLKKISDAGEQALTKFRQSGAQFVPTDQFSSSLQTAQGATEGLTTSTRGLTEAYHLLHPILSLAGVQLGEFRAFAVLAKEGTDLLAVALGAAIVIAAGKAADAVANLQRSMAFLFGAQGVAAIGDLGKGLEGLGASAEQLAPALTSAEQVLKRISAFKGVSLEGVPTFGSAEQQKAVTDAIATLERQLEILGETSAQATPQVNKLFDTLNQFDPKTGKNLGLTAQAFEQLRRTAPEVAQFVGDALQKNLGGDIFARLQKGPIDFMTVMRALAAQTADVFAKPIPGTAAQSFEALKKAATDLLAALGELGATKFFSELTQSINSVGKADFGSLKTELAAVEQGLNQFSQAAQAAGKTIHDALAQAFVAPAPQQIGVGVFDALVQNFQQSMDQLKAGATSVWLAIQQIFAAGTQQLQADLRGVSWADAWNGLVTAAQTAFQQIQSAWQTLVAFINSNRPNLSVGGGSTGGGFEVPSGGAAAGGLVSGPGSGTSDSIIARLSNFEYVMRAAAVKFYGVDFMHALNAMRLPKDFFRGFNLGGLVLPPFPSPPRFAQGGLAMAGQGRSLTLVLDGRSFAVAGPKRVVDELEQAADLHNLSRIGRAPGWVR